MATALIWQVAVLLLTAARAEAEEVLRARRESCFEEQHAHLLRHRDGVLPDETEFLEESFITRLE